MPERDLASQQRIAGSEWTISHHARIVERCPDLQPPGCRYLPWFRLVGNRCEYRRYTRFRCHKVDSIGGRRRRRSSGSTWNGGTCGRYRTRWTCRFPRSYRTHRRDRSARPARTYRSGRTSGSYRPDRAHGSYRPSRRHRSGTSLPRRLDLFYQLLRPGTRSLTTDTATSRSLAARTLHPARMRRHGISSEPSPPSGFKVPEPLCLHKALSISLDLWPPSTTPIRAGWTYPVQPAK